MLRMDEDNKIIKAHKEKGLNRNEIAIKFNRSWDTINRIVSSSPSDQCNQRKHPTRKRAKVIGSPTVVTRIKELLKQEEEKKVPLKQRFTAKILCKMLTEEGLYTGSDRYFRKIVQSVRRELKLLKQKTYLDLDFENGKFLQVDHGEAMIKIDGNEVNGYLFVGSVPGSVLRFCKFYYKKDSTSWGDFHESCFKYFGGVFPHCYYDRDSVIYNNKTDGPTVFMNELSDHYGFEPIFCNKASGWEKGSVENGVGYCRRNHLPGIKEFNDYSGVNDYLYEESHKENIKGDKKGMFDKCKAKLNPLPGYDKKWGKWVDLNVSSTQKIRFDNHYYSLPENLVGATVRVLVTTNELIVYFNNELIYTHNRSYGKDGSILVLDHYLDQLSRKPGAFRFSKVVKGHSFGEIYNRALIRLKAHYGEQAGIKEFVNILLLHRKHPSKRIESAVDQLLQSGGLCASSVETILKAESIVVTKCIPHQMLPDKCHQDPPQLDLSKYQNLTNVGG